MTVRLTHVGGPTVLLELDGWRILCDPTFDPPGRTYGFGLGTSSTKTAGPAIGPEELGPIDVVLLSHDHHADNLDDKGRELLPTAGTVLTTEAGARRLAAANVRGLRSGAATTLEAEGRPALRVRATPCRHGPPLSRLLVGQVVGFALSLAGEDGTAVWMTGDTVLHRRLRQAARQLSPDVLLLHAGSVQFPLTGPVRYSMDGARASRLVEDAAPRITVPVHYEGWSHFHEPTERLRSSLSQAKPAVRDTVRWLRLGEATTV